jgi:hypothetical protein
MTRFIPVSALALLLSACGGGDAPAESDSPPAPVEVAAAGDVVGAAPAAGAVLPASEVIARADELDGQVIRVEGEIAEVCQMAGCWLTFHNEAGVPFRVAVPREEGGGYEFTFPTDIAGSNIVVEGTLDVTETDAATRRHLAEDGGASPEEVAAITEPERTVVLNATGARIERAEGA